MPREATKGAVVRFWAPENESLIIGGESAIQFAEHRLMVRTPSIIKRLENGTGYGKLYFKVVDQKSEGEDRVRMMKFFNRLLEVDRSDQVKTERGIMAMFALFSEEELAELGVSRSSVDKEKLILAALDNKTIEGV